MLIHCVLQDTRPLEEYKVSHIPGAMRVDPDAEPELQALGIVPGSTGESEHPLAVSFSVLPSHYYGI